MKSKTGIKYLNRCGNRYCIKKKIGDKYIHFGSFNDLDEAKKYLEYCIENNWNLECKKRTYRKRGGKLYCISNPKPGQYQVIKSIDGKHQQFASFNNLQEAMEYRDYCVKNNWSSDCIQRKSNKYDLPKYVSWNKKSKRYCINKFDKDGKSIFHCFYKTLNEALHERDLLIKYDWDENKLIELDEAYGSLWENNK